MAKRKKTKQNNISWVYLIIILLGLIIGLILVLQPARLWPKAEEVRIPIDNPYTKTSPSNNLCLGSRKVKFSFFENQRGLLYPHDAYFEILSGGIKKASSGWLAKAITDQANPTSWEFILDEDGAYSWRVATRTSQKELGPYDYWPQNFAIDTTPPSKPECSIITYQHPYDPNNPVVSWKEVKDVGCAGLHKKIPYQVDVSLKPDFSVICQSSYRNALSWATTTSQCRLEYPVITKAYARVRAQDSFGNWSGWGSCEYSLLPR